ncbi:MAG: hypothetical protein KF749_10165 [Bacteroidetes bacterium]|nr:hypothetical protein [Bacteroidota bacterium]MCW5896672.1 hypothetical protein [Bacteroidota bacterium]
MQCRSLLFAALFAVPAFAYSQTMVKVNLLDLYGQVPSPPKSVQEAYSRAKCTVNGDNYFCDTKEFYRRINEKINKIGEQVERTNVALTVPGTPAMASVDPQVMERKMASMSQAEKVQYAMAVMQQMNLGPKALAPESDEVQKAVEEYSRLAGDTQGFAERVARKGQIDVDRDRKHREVNAWAEAEIGKLPYVDFSEAGRFKDQRKVHAIHVKAMEKHIAVENEYLDVFRKYWNDVLLAYTARYTTLQQNLAAINYGEDAKNIETKRHLIGAMQLMMGPASELLVLSGDATNTALNWWTQKLKLDYQSRSY